MSRRVSSYIGGGIWRQSRLPARVLAVALAALSLGGCAGMGLPFNEAGTTSTASARDPSKPVLASASSVVDRVDPSDWEVIRITLAGAPEGAASDLEWMNPDTGSTGTIAATEPANRGGTFCRSFATTLNDVRGVRRYRGDICAPPGGRWQIRSVSPDDAVIS